MAEESAGSAAFESVKDFAKRASTNPNHIYALVAQRRIPHSRLGRKIMIPIDALERIIVDANGGRAA